MRRALFVGGLSAGSFVSVRVKRRILFVFAPLDFFNLPARTIMLVACCIFT